MESGPRFDSNRLLFCWLDVDGLYKHVLCSNPGSHTIFSNFVCTFFIYFEYLSFSTTSLCTDEYLHVLLCCLCIVSIFTCETSDTMIFILADVYSQNFGHSLACPGFEKFLGPT
jgi:hypothetical protein